jgi:phosphoglycolate phosphatase-like HAD superfamily hydrolase
VQKPKPRYQFFLSSTFQDLESERAILIRVLLKHEWMPVAMEYFSGAEVKPWDLIKTLIDSCDYFILLLARRAGTLHEGVPITQKEYEYAGSKGKPIVRFILDDNGLGNYPEDDSPEQRAAFINFRATATQPYYYPWKDRTDLAVQAGVGLHKLVEACPQPGWLPGPSSTSWAAIHEIGLTSVYANRDEAIPLMLDDIRRSQKSCFISAGVYVNQLIRVNHHDRIAAALSAAAMQTDRAAPYRVTFCSLSPFADDDRLPGPRNEYLLNMWASREGDKSVSMLQRRIEAGSNDFEALTKQLKDNNIVFERRYFKDYLISHGLVVIDDTIAYVFFYDGTTRSGASALTMRFANGSWAQKFATESNAIRTQFSFRDYRTIAFDFDGVVADSMSIQGECWEQALRACGVKNATAVTLMRNFWEGAAGIRIFEGVPVSPHIRQRLREAKDALFTKRRSEVKAFRRADAVLKALKSKGKFKLALATTADKRYLSRFIRDANLVDCFDTVVTDADVRDHPKPHPQMIFRIASQTACEPWQVCVVGDTRTDFDLSRNARCGFLHFRSHDRHGVPGGESATESWGELCRYFLGEENSSRRR